MLGPPALLVGWMVVPILDGQDFTLDDGMGGPVSCLYVGCLFLSFTMRVPDGLARGKVRFRPHLGLLLRLTVLPVGWVMVLFVGLTAPAFAGPNSSLVLQILLLLGGLAAAVLALLLLAWLMVTAGSRVDRDEASTPHRSLQPGANGTQRASYYFQGSPNTAQKTHPFNGPYNDNWQATDSTDWAQLVWAPCGVQRNFNINTELRVTAGSTSSGKVSFMTMDSTDGDISTIYHMAWKECPQR